MVCQERKREGGAGGRAVNPEGGRKNLHLRDSAFEVCTGPLQGDEVCQDNSGTLPLPKLSVTPYWPTVNRQGGSPYNTSHLHVQGHPWNWGWSLTQAGREQLMCCWTQWGRRVHFNLSICSALKYNFRKTGEKVTLILHYIRTYIKTLCCQISDWSQSSLSIGKTMWYCIVLFISFYLVSVSAADMCSRWVGWEKIPLTHPGQRQENARNVLTSLDPG